MDVDDELSWFIVDYLGDNVELLYEKSVSRIWKEISCEIKFEYNSVYKWQDLKKYFLNTLLHELDKYFVPNEVSLRRLRYPFMGILLRCMPEFVDESYHPTQHHLQPKQKKLAKIFIKYTLCGSFSEEIYSDLLNFRDIEQHKLVINIKDPHLNISPIDYLALKKLVGSDSTKTNTVDSDDDTSSSMYSHAASQAVTFLNSSAYLAEPPEISLQASTTAYDNISQTELNDTDSIDEMQMTKILHEICATNPASRMFFDPNCMDHYDPFTGTWDYK